jgi:SAM-dependent methyltransferase
MSGSDYVGTELELFSEARNWKAYLYSEVKDYLHGRVLEVGAGMGGTTSMLCDGTQEHWLCLEPDGKFVAILESKIRRGDLAPCCSAKQGTLAEVPMEPRFDSILYVDVLEHIADAEEELRRAVQRLKIGGFLVIVAPAHPRLHSRFDEAIGHLQRYSKESLTMIISPSLELITCRFLDSVGTLCSLANRYLLKRERPTKRQIWFWDRVIIPCSRLVDPLMRHTSGRSLLAVYRHRPS